MAKKETRTGFEANIRRLEQIVSQLEKGDIELEKSLKLYAEGARLVEACRKQLADAETQIEKLRPTGDGLAAEPFEPQQ